MKRMPDAIVMIVGLFGFLCLAAVALLLSAILAELIEWVVQHVRTWM